MLRCPPQAPALAVAACFLIPTVPASLAGVAYNAGTVTLTYRSGTSGNPIVGTGTLSPVPSSNVIGEGAFQLDRTNTSGNNQASAKASVGHVVNSTTGSFTLRPGTGVRQVDPGNAFPNSTRLTVTVNRLDFLATSSPVGALSSSYFSFRVAGTNESTAVKSRVSYDLTLRNADTNIVVGQFGPATREYLGSATLSFVDTITLGSKLGSAINVGQRLRITGVFDMETALAAAAPRPGAAGDTATFAAGTSSIELDDFTIGSGGEIYTYRTAATTQQLFSTAANWRRFDGATVAPNSVLAMAFFPNDRGADRTLTLDTARTLGHIDVSGSAATRINPKDLGQPLSSPALTLGSASLPATVRTGGEAGNGFLEIGPQVLVGSTLEVSAETTAGTVFSGPISFSAATGAELNKTGAGDAFFNAIAANNVLIVHREGQSFHMADLDGARASVTVLGDTGSTWRSFANQQIRGLRVLERGAVVMQGSGRRVLKVTSLDVDAPSGARIDLTDGGLILDYSSSSEASRLALIRNLVTTGRAGGSWLGAGITAQEAVNVPSRLAVGFIPKSAYAPSTFMGLGVDGTSIMARLTYLGDATLDGSVSIADFGVLAANFNGTGRSWHQGDFTFDGAVNIADFSLLALNFNLALGADPGEVTLPTGGHRGTPAVPEPALAGLGILAGTALVGSCRRRR